MATTFVLQIISAALEIVPVGYAEGHSEEMSILWNK